MPSIRDVAKEANVSIATVSRVINGVDSVAPGLRRRVMEAVEACDYTPAVGRRAMQCVALLYPGPFCIGSPYDSACLEGMSEAMRAAQYDLTVLDIARDKTKNESLRQFLTRKGARGAVVRCTAAERPLLLPWVEESLPLVILGDHFDCPQASFVYAESRTASEQAIEHLVSLGHERIAFAACERDDGDHLDRLLAYQAVMDRHGIADEKLVCRVPPHRLDGVQLLRNLLGMPNRPTAIYIADPLVAVGAVNEAHRMGVKIPNDLSVVGFDDTDIRSAVYPRMSAVCQDARELGRAAMQSVIAQIERQDHQGPRSQAFEAWLDLCNTTGPPPANAERILPTGARVSG